MILKGYDRQRTAQAYEILVTHAHLLRDHARSDFQSGALNAPVIIQLFDRLEARYDRLMPEFRKLSNSVSSTKIIELPPFLREQCRQARAIQPPHNCR